MSKKIMILGCGGMLGDAVYKHFSQENEVSASDINVIEPWLHPLDVTSLGQITAEAATFKPDVLINLAAKTDMEWCERNWDATVDTNTMGSMNCAVVAEALKIPYVYICTAGIFDGEKDTYDDDDKPNPASVYAKTKYFGEILATKIRRHFVLRAGWMMGGGPSKDKKFVNKIYKQLAAGAKTLYVVNDKAGTPTYTKDFARGIDQVLQYGRYGVYNQVCDGDCTRYDVAKEIVRLLGSDVKVESVDSSYFEQEYFAPRPRSEKLIPRKLKESGLYVMRPWQESLAEYLKEFPPIEGRK